MAAPATTEEFIDLVRRSGVSDEKRLDAYTQQLRSASNLPDSPGKAAGLLVQEGLLTHFQAEQILMGKWRRFTIGKYKVLERLGSGGMGSVYLCEHRFMRRRVAVKVLPAAKAEDQASLERFYREARAAAALDHPNIVRAYDIDQDENLHFLVMEYVDGASLQEVIKKFGPMNFLYAAHYARQAAIGLQHAHEAGLVHRDIKPGNVLIDRTGTIKVLDMGLARFFHDEEDILTKKYDESVLGTADYLAPEQALDSHGVDIRADIYSLGATVYFCLTGQPPFNEGTVAQKLIWHQTRQPKPVRSYRADVPEGLAQIIDRMMTKDRARRFQTPAQVVDALAPWTAKPIQPPPDAWMPRLSPAAMGPMEAAASVTAPTPAPGVLPAAAQRPPTATPAPMARTAAPVAQQLRPTTPQPASRPSHPTPIQAAQRPAAPTPVAQQRPLPNNGAISGTAPAPNWGDMSPSARRTAAPTKSALKYPSQRQARFASLLGSIKRRPKLWAIGAGAVGLFVLILFIVILVFALSGGNGPGKGPATTGKKLSVSAAGKGDYKSIREALLKASAGDRIAVLDETVEEMLDLQPLAGKVARDLTVEPDASVGKRIIWRPPPPQREGQQSAQLLSLAHCDGLTIKGFTFQGVNSSHQIQDLIIVFGKCPGLRLEDLQLQQFRRSAVKLMNCSGEASRPIVLKRLYAVQSLVPAEATALVCEVRSNSTLTMMHYVNVEDCLFEGPYRAGVLVALDAGCQLGNVDFLRNRFFRCTDGMWYRRPTGRPLPPIGLNFDSNTWFGMDRAFHFETMPLDVSASKVTFKNNLFVQVKNIAQVGDFKAGPVFNIEAGNFRDASTTEANLALKAAAGDCASLVIDPNASGPDHVNLLRYPRTSPLNAAGINGGPVGAPPAE
jgi:serine/threonine protein kinase